MKHGGARQGAGRKPAPIKKIPVAFRIEQDLLDKLLVKFKTRKAVSDHIIEILKQSL